ncbi:14804_t:CDS:1 [Funneliformis geosporum]|uniref:14804_t:CDS:1 n=1 Tax=Funneliformis geosporum TaxID=1117311 RepID=A0A9W4SEA9_9GLOM|nr:14804_t:CDS:1 [Funneliformis geosporum]
MSQSSEFADLKSREEGAMNLKGLRKMLVLVKIKVVLIFSVTKDFFKEITYIFDLLLHKYKTTDDTVGKVNILLQAYLSILKIIDSGACSTEYKSHSLSFISNCFEL